MNDSLFKEPMTLYYETIGDQIHVTTDNSEWMSILKTSASLVVMMKDQILKEIVTLELCQNVMVAMKNQLEEECGCES